MPTPDEATINTYLRYLEDESSLKDEAAIEAARAEVERASSPTDKLIALSKVDRLEHVDPSELIAQFVVAAKAFSAEHNITPNAWRAMGVPVEVLTRIGGPATGGATAARAARVTADDVEATIPDSGTFRLSDLSGSPATRKAVIERLMESGSVEYVGRDEQHEGRGARPKVYRRVS